LYYRQAATSAENRNDSCGARAHKFYQKAKDEAWRKPIEFTGVVVVILYTAFAGYQSCKMREANNLTRNIMRSTTSASLRCYVGDQWFHNKATGPITGGFFVRCNNSGKAAAEGVGGDITVVAKSFPDEKVLFEESWPFGGNQEILGSDSQGNPSYYIWHFFSQHFSPDKDPKQISEGKEIVIGSGVMSYRDETGEKTTRYFCDARMNTADFGGSPDTWTECSLIEAERDMRLHSSGQQATK
jgi:hypothetical protein